jgi:hypothetical protein
VSLDEFRQLRWLEGTWRGSGARGAAFFEAYALIDDSTLVISHFADSTLGGRTDGGRVFLRAGVVWHDVGEARWVAARLDAGSVRFEPVRGARTGFTWRRESASTWTATLHAARNAHDVSAMYRMERVARSATVR